MKITYLSTSVVPSRTANSVHVMRMCQALAGHGYSVELVAQAKDGHAIGGEETSDPFKFYGVASCFSIKKIRNGGGPLGELAYAIFAGLHARLARSDIVYGRHLRACVIVAYMWQSVVFELHSLDFRHRWENRFAFRMLIRSRSCKRIIVISDALRSDLLKLYPELDGRVIVAHDGADPIIDPENVLPRPEQPFQIGYVGHLCEGRGFDLMAEIARRLPWSEIHVVGGKDEEIAQLRSRNALPVNLILHGFMKYSDAEKMRSRCAVLLAPYEKKVMTSGGSNTSRWMSPLKIFEYMASGRAIVCSDIPVLREVLQPDKTAFFCSPENVDEWCDAIKRLAENESLRINLGREARRQFLKKYTWEARAKTVLEGI